MVEDSYEYGDSRMLQATVQTTTQSSTNTPTSSYTELLTTSSPTTTSTSIFTSSPTTTSTSLSTLSPSSFPSSYPSNSPSYYPSLTPTTYPTATPTIFQDDDNETYIDDDAYADDAYADDAYADDDNADDNDDINDDDAQDDDEGATKSQDDDVQMSLTSPSMIASMVFGGILLALLLLCMLRLYNSKRKPQAPTIAAQKGVVMIFGDKEEGKSKSSKKKKSTKASKTKSNVTLESDSQAAYCADMSDSGYFGDSYNNSSSNSTGPFPTSPKGKSKQNGKHLKVDTSASMMEQGLKAADDDEDEKSPLIEKKKALTTATPKSVKFSNKVDVKSVSSDGSTGSSSFSSRGELIESFRSILIQGIEVLLHSSIVPGKSRRIRMSLIPSPGGTGASYRGCMLFIQPTSRITIRRLTKRDKIKLSDIVFIEKGKRTTVFQTCDSALDVADVLCLSLVLSDDETIDLQTANKMEREALFQGISLLVQEERIAL